jgi:hypothetical protein
VPADQCVDTALTEARRLGQFDATAYAGTKKAIRQATIDKVLPTLATAKV